MNPIFGLLSSAIEPLTQLIDELHTSTEERLTIKQELFRMQIEVTNRVLDYETKLMEARSQVITAEAQGQSWLQRSWRPITMLTFLVLVVFDSVGWLPLPLAKEAWMLLQIGLGGYVVGRSLEKIAPQVSRVMTKD